MATGNRLFFQNFLNEFGFLISKRVMFHSINHWIRLYISCCGLFHGKYRRSQSGYNWLSVMLCKTVTTFNDLLSLNKDGNGINS